MIRAARGTPAVRRTERNATSAAAPSAIVDARSTSNDSPSTFVHAAPHAAWAKSDTAVKGVTTK